MQVHITSASIQPLSVAGPDLDRDLVGSLIVGDKVLVEMNGQRLFTNNPIAAEAWEVVEASDYSLTIEHPNGFRQVLPIDTILAGAIDGSSVFLLQSDNPLCPYIYVILQLIAYKTDIEGLRNSNYVWWFKKDNYTELFADPIIKRGIMEAWGDKFRTFQEKGWGDTSFKRFALRANIKTDVIRSFINEAWEEIDALSLESLLGIAREFEWLPTRIQLNSLIQHDFNGPLAKNCHS